MNYSFKKLYSTILACKETIKIQQKKSLSSSFEICSLMHPNQKCYAR